MKGVNGIQFQAYLPFVEFVKEDIKERLEKGKDKEKISGKRYSLTIAKYFLHHKDAYKTLINADINLEEGKEFNTIQFQAHPTFIKFKKQLKNDRIKHDKEGNGELSDKRLSLVIVKFFVSYPEAHETILNAEIDKNEA